MTKQIVKAGASVQALVPTNIEEAFRISQAIAMSHMAPMIGSKADRRPMGPEEVMATILAGMEVGLKPMASLRAIALINGRPAFWGDGQLALIQSREDYGGMDESLDGEVATCTVRRVLPNGETAETTRTFSMEQAQKAKLTGKSGPWQDYPERMLQHRARGFALRDAFSDALMGILSEAEAYDTPPDPDDIPLIEGDVVKDSPEDPTPYEEVDENVTVDTSGKPEIDNIPNGMEIKHEETEADDGGEQDGVEADRPDEHSEEAGEPEPSPDSEPITGDEEPEPTEKANGKLSLLVRSVHKGLYDKKTKRAVDNFYATQYKARVEEMPEDQQAIIEHVYFAHIARVKGEITPEEAANRTKEALAWAEK